MWLSDLRYTAARCCLCRRVDALASAFADRGTCSIWRVPAGRKSHAQCTPAVRHLAQDGLQDLRAPQEMNSDRDTTRRINHLRIDIASCLLADAPPIDRPG